MKPLYKHHSIFLLLTAVSSAAFTHPLAAKEPIELDCVIEPRATIELGSAAEGILEEVLVGRGDLVQKGMPVARLESELEQNAAEAARLRAENLVEIRSQEEQARFRLKEVDRLRTMRKTQAVPEQEFDKAEIEHLLAKFALDAARTEHRLAEVELDRAESNVKRREIRSPIDGVVKEVLMEPGEYVHEQAQLMVLAETDPLFVEVFVPVPSYGQISEGMLADVEPEEPVGGRYQAEVIVVDNVFDPASRTFGVRLELANPEHKLPAGLRCKVYFQTVGTEQ